MVLRLCTCLQFLGPASHLQQPGDFLSSLVTDSPYVACIDQAGKLQAYHNVRHFIVKLSSAAMLITPQPHSTCYRYAGTMQQQSVRMNMVTQINSGVHIMVGNMVRGLLHVTFFLMDNSKVDKTLHSASTNIYMLHQPAHAPQRLLTAAKRCLCCVCQPSAIRCMHCDVCTQWQMSLYACSASHCTVLTGLDGRLQKASKLKGIKNFRTSQMGLLPVDVAAWQGFLFINASSKRYCFLRIPNCAT